jgi:HK97 family phage prohead protease
MTVLELKRQRVPLTEVKVDADGHTMEGVLSTWDLDLGGDIIHRGAFKRTLSHWRNSERVIPLIDSHDAHTSVENAIGKLVEAKETKAGLWTKWDILEGDPKADAIMARMAAGIVDGLSIGYRAKKVEEPTDEERRGGVWRHLKEVELREGSVVIFPMNEGSRINAGSIKGLVDQLAELGDPTEEQVAELKELRDRLEGLLSKDSADPDAKPDPGDPEPVGLSPDDPKRRQMERRARDITIRGRATLAGHSTEK